MNPSTPVAHTTSARRRPLSWADSGGVLGAVLAALCCAGTPLIVSGLAALAIWAWFIVQGHELIVGIDPLARL